MNVLVIGGTRFLGPHVVREALAHGHTVTAFNRGSRALEAMPGLTQTRGDRRGDYTALGAASFDAVIDTCAYHPDDVSASATALATRCSRYCLISTVSVYADASGALDERAPLAAAPVPLPASMTLEHYGALKALSERRALETFGDRLLVVRPGLIAGPGDKTHRFGYWVRRIARGGDVLAPLPADAPVEFIDVRDLAAWIVLAVERGLHGAYNANGPANPLTMSGFLDTCVACLASDARLRWVSPEHLVAASVEPWSELPLWLPPDSGGFISFDAGKARRDGLACRPVAATIAAVRAWDREHGPPDADVPTLKAQKERAILVSLDVAASSLP